MGKKPDEIKRGIEERRQRITDKVNGLQDRFEVDLEQAVNAAGEEASGVFRRVDQKLHLEERMQKSPMGVLAGALGVGVVMGAASESINLRDNNNNDQPSRSNGRHSNNGRSSPLDGAFSGIASMASDVLGQEMREFVRASLYGSERSRQDGQDRQAKEGNPEDESRNE